MPNVKVADLKPGNVTAMDVLSADGRLLLPAGTKLTSRHIRMLRARGVEHVVTGSGRRGPEPAPPAGSPEAARRIAQRFQHSDPGHPFVNELARICESRVSQRE